MRKRFHKTALEKWNVCQSVWNAKAMGLMEVALYSSAASGYLPINRREEYLLDLSCDIVGWTIGTLSCRLSCRLSCCVKCKDKKEERVRF